MKNTFLLLCFFICWHVKGQENFVFSPINSANGLSDNHVRSLCQLPDGRMVIITQGLVNIYDGTAFRYMHFNEQRAYPLPNYSGWHHAYIDNENHLWLKTQYKLMLFDIRTELFVENVDSIFAAQKVKRPVVDFFVDSEHNSWYVTANNELIFRKAGTKTPKLFRANVSKVQGKPDVLYDVVLHNGSVFLFYKSGNMVCYDLATAKELYTEDPFNGNNPYTNTLMVAVHNNYLYQVRNGYQGGLMLRFDVTNRKWERVLETKYWLNTLTIDNKGNCWISSFAGLLMINENLKDKHPVSPLHLVDGRIFDTEISTQFNDNQGGLWIGTENRGLLYYHPERFKFRNFGRPFFKTNNRDNLKVLCFADGKDYVLSGTEKGVYQYSRAKQTIEPFTSIPANTQCHAMLNDSKGRIWLCSSNNSLYCLDKNKLKHYSLPFVCLNIFEAPGGDFYLCTQDGLATFDPESGNYKIIENSQNGKLNRVKQLIGYRGGSLVGISDNGPFIYDLQTQAISLKADWKQQHNNHQYNCLFYDRRGLLWFGTQDGLYCYYPNNNKSRGFFEENGLINNSIRSITEDNSGRLWVSASNGISRIEITGKSGQYSYSFANFNRFDGIIENEFLPRSVLKTSDNRLLWGGLDGFNEIDLNRIDSFKQPLPPPLFTRLLISGTEIRRGQYYNGNIILKQSITSTKQVNLRYNQNFVGLEFSALNYINPTQTYYRYQLEGVDDSVREIRTNDGIGRVNYTNLTPGSYRLKVFSADNNRVWSNNYAQISIYIRPPFWKTTWAWIAYSIAFLGALFLVVMRYIHWHRKKMLQQQKEALEQIKYSFFTNISHELRTPLTLILTPLGSILKKTEEGALKTQLTNIYRNASDLLRLVNQLLDFRKLEMSGETIQLSYCNLSEFMENLVLSFKELAKEKGINFTFENTGKGIYANIDTDKLHKIVNNLLSNAFKFTPEGGFVKLLLENDSPESPIKIEVTDTGCGIPTEEQGHIFDRFYQAKSGDRQSGSGIGLHLVKEYVNMHKGSIEVKSQLNQGCTFIVHLPANLSLEVENAPQPSKNENKNSVKILVVEDNFEFRAFLCNELSEKFNVLAATNGNDGLEKVLEHEPHLVITDVMMPGMTGTELCLRLKGDLHTSHIPVILLTAKSSDQAQIEGLKAGADDYISKPFNMDILLLKITRLIEQQEQRKKLFKNSIVISPGSLTSTNVDEEFIKKVLGHIEKNMENDLYSVDQLSKDLYMDRTGLYRKLTAITGQTPTVFMRLVRLKRAAQLLQNGLPVSEVAEKVGFGTNSYFTKCFQEEFGVKPSQYKNNRKITEK